MTVLVTGAAGFIGTHILVELHNEGIPYLAIDNFSNSSAHALQAVSKITGTRVPFINGDVTESGALSDVMGQLAVEDKSIEAVIHCAAFKAVAESVSDPLRYYENNLLATIRVLQWMTEHQIQNFIFSSSATVYGEPTKLPFDESHAVAPTNAYGHTKAMSERVLADWAVSHKGKVLSLRYFNPVGAHPSGIIGEDPRGVPNNLFPYITRVALGELPYLCVYGDDYPTVDGTGVRDYVHVVDLARAHVQAVKYSLHEQSPGFLAMNLGTGKGTSVMELVQEFERASGKKLPVKVVQRRQGDVASMWADPSFAQQMLNWKSELSLTAICKDGWRWQSLNPRGFQNPT